MAGGSVVVAGGSKERLVRPAGWKVKFTQPHSNTDRQDTVHHDTMSHATPILTDIQITSSTRII